jgi:hypothetical protein
MQTCHNLADRASVNVIKQYGNVDRSVTDSIFIASPQYVLLQYSVNIYNLDFIRKARDIHSTGDRVTHVLDHRCHFVRDAGSYNAHWFEIVLNTAVCSKQVRS